MNGTVTVHWWAFAATIFASCMLAQWISALLGRWRKR